MHSATPVPVQTRDDRSDNVQPETTVEDEDCAELKKLTRDLSVFQFCRYHELYLRKDQAAYLVPIIFEDGMDFHECAQYYASLQSQEPSTRAPCLRKRLQRKTSLRELQQLMNNSPSCLRRSRRYNSKIDLRYSSKIDLESAKLRRCSFNGVAPVTAERSTLQRSNSHRDVKESSPGVSFDQFIQVVTIPSAFEYPEDVRAKVWMSRQEMRMCMQRAVAEKVAERRRQQQQQQQQQEAQRGVAAEETKEVPQRQNSDNCVMAECQHTSTVLAAI